MHLPSLPLRMLLTTDGRVTTLLEASFRAPIAVETITNTVDGVFGRGTRRGVRRYERADRRGQEPLRPVAAMLALSIAGTCC